VTSTQGFDVRSYDFLPDIEARSFWFRSRNRLIAWVMGRYFAGARSLLEVGCGTGFVLQGLREEFPELELTGSDLFEQGLEIARRRLPDARLLHLDARALPFDADFDVVGGFDVLEHIEEDEVALASMVRAIKPGGGIILTVPQHPSMWSAVDEYGQHARRYTRRELVGKLERSGLRVERVTSFVSLLLPLMALSRARQRRLDETFDPLADFRHSRILDVSLERIMDVERMAIRTGISWPAGGSLLGVARRG
jgi:ubiquinone/menaquinone biosynthesis C-methylase UbiE